MFMNRLKTTTDFRAMLLLNELKAKGIFARIDSNTNSGLSAGFGTTGMAQVFVNDDDLTEAQVILAAFMERMTQEEE
jgi:hypothetical protein